MRQEFLFTHHAVERYIQRHARHLSFNEAVSSLQEGAKEAEVLPEKTMAGQTQWLLREPRVVLVTKSEAKRCVVVTVLPREATPGEWMGEEEWEAQPPPEPFSVDPPKPDVHLVSVMGLKIPPEGDPEDWAKAAKELPMVGQSGLVDQLLVMRRKVIAQGMHNRALEAYNNKIKNILRLTIIALLDCQSQNELAAMVIAKIESENSTLLSDAFLGRRRS